MMPLNDGLSAIFTLINPILPTFHMQAPPNSKLPFIVIQPVGGTLDYVFVAGAIESHRIQIAQYYEYPGKNAQAITDNEAIVAALDRQALAVGGIIMRRLTLPIITVQEGRILQCVQFWQWQNMT